MPWTKTVRREYARTSTRYASDLNDRERGIVGAFLPVVHADRTKEPRDRIRWNYTTACSSHCRVRCSPRTPWIWVPDMIMHRIDRSTHYAERFCDFRAEFPQPALRNPRRAIRQESVRQAHGAATAWSSPDPGEGRVHRVCVISQAYATRYRPS